MKKFFDNQNIDEIASKILLTYNWKLGQYPDNGNNWEGHYFIAPNGWYFDITTHLGPYGVPISESVKIYENDTLLSYELSVSFNDKIKMIDFMKENYDCIKYDNDICTAIVEYLYAIYKGRY